MNPRTTEIIECLDAELAGLRAAVASVPPDRRAIRPAPDRWSVVEVLEHVAMVEKTVLKVCARELAAARDAGLAAETEASSIRGALPPERIARRDRALQSPDRLRPTGIDEDTAWAHIDATRAQFREFVLSCDGLALGQVSFPHPAFGPLNLYQWLLFAAGHHARHAAQIREIGQQLA